MSAARRIRQPPSRATTVGFELEAPGHVEVEVEARGAVVRVVEHRDGKPVGELELATFEAALVIDRDGILEDKAHEVASGAQARLAAPVPVSLPGGSGVRIDGDVLAAGARAAMPYVVVLALAPHDLAANGGVVVTIRRAGVAWPAGDAILRSLRLLGRGRRSANDAADAAGELPALPLVGEDEP